MATIGALSLTLLDRIDIPTEPSAKVLALSGVRTVTHNRVEEATLPPGPDFIIKGLLRDCNVSITEDPAKQQEWEEWNKQLTPEQNEVATKRLDAACANMLTARREDGKEKTEIALTIADRLMKEYSNRGYKIEKVPDGLPTFKLILGEPGLDEMETMLYEDMLLKDPQKAEVFKETILSVGGPDHITVYLDFPELDADGFATGFGVHIHGPDLERTEFTMDDQEAFEQAVKKAIDEML